MYSTSSVRPPKRHRDDLEDKIETLSKVINSMSGTNKTFLQAKLCNIKLKQQKLIALSRCRSPEPGKQSMVTELDRLIAESDLEIEIETIRSSKKFRRTENKFLKGLIRNYSKDPCNLIPCEASTSTSHNAYVETPNTDNINTPHINQNLPNAHNITMCDESMNTEPVYSVNYMNAEKTMLCEDRRVKSTSFMKEMSVLEENVSPVRSVFPSDNMPPMQEGMLLDKNESTNNVNLLRTGAYTFSQDYLNENSKALPPQSDMFVTRITEKEYKSKTHEGNTKKRQKPKVTSVSESVKEIAIVQNNEDVTSFPNVNISSNGNTENVTVEMLKTSTSKTTMVLPEATKVLSDSKHSHKTIANLFGTYKNIYSSQNFTTEFINNLKSIQNHEKYENKLLANTNDLKMATKYMEKSIKKTDCKKTFENCTEVLQQSEPSTNKVKKTCKSRKSTESTDSFTKALDLSTNFNDFFAEPQDLSVKKNLPTEQHLPTKSKSSAKSQDLHGKSKNSSAKSQVLSAKSRNLSAKSQDLHAKSKNSSAKSQDLSGKSEDSSAKSQDLPAKFKDLSAKSQNLFAKSKDLSAKSQDLSAKFKDLSTKSQDLFAKPKDSFAKSQDLHAKSKNLSTKFQDLPAKFHQTYQTQKTMNKMDSFELLTKSKNPMKRSSKSSSKKDKTKDSTQKSCKIFADENSVLYMTQLMKNGMEKNGDDFCTND